MTLSVIRGEPIEPGQRHNCFYSAAANLGEFGCTQQLAEALLMEPGQSSGLTRADVARQIRCGLAAGNPLVKGAMEKFGARITDVTDQEGPWNR